MSQSSAASKTERTCYFRKPSQSKDDKNDFNRAVQDRINDQDYGSVFQPKTALGKYSVTKLVGNDYHVSYIFKY